MKYHYTLSLLAKNKTPGHTKYWRWYNPAATLLLLRGVSISTALWATVWHYWIILLLAMGETLAHRYMPGATRWAIAGSIAHCSWGRNAVSHKLHEAMRELEWCEWIPGTKRYIMTLFTHSSKPAQATPCFSESLLQSWRDFYQLARDDCSIFRRLFITGNLKFTIVRVFIYITKIRKSYRLELWDIFFSGELLVEHLSACCQRRGARPSGIVTMAYFYTGWCSISFPSLHSFQLSYIFMFFSVYVISHNKNMFLYASMRQALTCLECLSVMGVTRDLAPSWLPKPVSGQARTVQFGARASAALDAASGASLSFCTVSQGSLFSVLLKSFEDGEEWYKFTVVALEGQNHEPILPGPWWSWCPETTDSKTTGALSVNDFKQTGSTANTQRLGVWMQVVSMLF